VGRSVGYIFLDVHRDYADVAVPELVTRPAHGRSTAGRVVTSDLYRTRAIAHAKGKTEMFTAAALAQLLSSSEAFGL
jgi:hypothetical protein